MSKRVLIAGAGVTGPTAAYWLAKHGWQVTVIERADDLRLGGQNIDISDAAREVVEMMGVKARIKDHHTGEKGLQFVDTDGNSVADYPTDKAGSLTREIEILRGDLVKILADSNPDEVDYRFGRSIDALDDTGDEVRVTFDDGKTESFDIVLAADGMNSRTRAKIIGEGDYEDYLGCWSSYFTIPRNETDNDWWRWYTSPTGVIAFLRPDNKGTMRASVNFLSDDGDPPHMSLDEKKDRLRERLDGAGWESERIAAALDGADDVWLGPLHQIKAESWSKGRCALLGDAAHCPTPYTGMGTTLAIIGAYIAANELVAHEDHEAAFAAYEEKFRAFARKSQQLPPGVPDMAYAESGLKVKLVNTGAAFGASRPVQAIASFFGGGEDKNEFDLPRYAHNCDERSEREAA